VATKKKTGKAVATKGNANLDKSKRVALASMGAGAYGLGGMGTQMGFGTNFYSPYMSTDFMELPQSRFERLERQKFWYRTHPYIGQAVDLHTELPLSKLRLAKPKIPSGAIDMYPSLADGQEDTPEAAEQRAEDGKLSKETVAHYNRLCKRSYRFFRKLTERLNLFQVLVDISFEYNLHDEAWVFAEDSDTPGLGIENFESEDVGSLMPDGTTRTSKKLTAAGKKAWQGHFTKKYRGWDQIIILPPESVQEEVFQFSKRKKVYLIPDEMTKELINRAMARDPDAEEQVKDIPDEVLLHVSEGRNIPLGTNPEKGSFVHQVYRRKHTYRAGVIPRMERLERTLTYQDKLRQAQTSIASRAMTPKRLVWAEDLDEADVENLREQVDLALMDPDFSIVTNYEVHWEDIGARDRLLDLDREHETGNREIYAGYGVTETMLTGEGVYSGDRISVEIINTRYMLFRDRIQHYVEKMLFEPVARKKGFIIRDIDGDDIAIYPSLSFTRLAIRDNAETYDAFYNLYQKGSMPVRFMLELLNVDADAALEELEKDVFTLNDSSFNEILRSVNSEVGRWMAENTDVGERIATYLDLQVKKKEEADRFGG